MNIKEVTVFKEMKVLLNDFEHMTRITVSREKYTNERKKTRLKGRR